LLVENTPFDHTCLIGEGDRMDEVEIAARLDDG